VSRADIVVAAVGRAEMVSGLCEGGGYLHIL
jgi:5,10-methylene-tetrahydrofolate dehydrogenase/methenyl tetrahydrofolate cyclohydrolase